MRLKERRGKEQPNVGFIAGYQDMAQISGEKVCKAVPELYRYDVSCSDCILGDLYVQLTSWVQLGNSG